MSELAASRLTPADVVRTGSLGLRSRRLRASLSLIGVAIGIASLVAVLGLSESSRAGLLAQLDTLGTNLLVVAPGQSFFGDSATLPGPSRSMIAAIPPVESAASVEALNANVYRSSHIDPGDTNGITVESAGLNLLSTLHGQLAAGSWLNAATSRYPTVVLGAVAAQRLGISRLTPDLEVWLGGRRFTVVGILAPFPLEPEIDRAALVGQSVARDLLKATGHASSVYVRVQQDQVDQVHGVLAATANPAHPEQVDVSRPSDALAARAAAKGVLRSLFLGLGAIALLVGGIGVANVMVISVLERRAEIGLRRALGATKRHVRLQFLTEALLLAGLGGVLGVVAGALATTGFAHERGWQTVVPPIAVIGGLAAALLVGALAGIYPAARAARLAPTDALRST
jgi:putative ABC transport system permease protein